MKYLFLFVSLLAALYVNAQEKTYTFDYTATYVVPNNKLQKVDTIAVAFNRSGSHLWTDARSLGKDFAGILNKNQSTMDQDIDVNIIYEAETGGITFNLKESTGTSEMMLKSTIANLMAPEEPAPLEQDGTLVTKLLETQTEIIGELYNTYSITPSSNPDNVIYMTINESLPVDNQYLLSNLIDQLAIANLSSGSLNTSLPQGLILNISFGEQTLIEAVHVETTPKTIFYNYQFSEK